MDVLATGVIWLLGLIIAILWILIPFLIMGTNRRLDRIIKQNSLMLEQRGGQDDTAPTYASEYVGAIRSLVTGKDN